MVFQFTPFRHLIGDLYFYYSHLLGNCQEVIFIFNKNIFSSRLKQLRKDNNLTLQELGTNLNVTKQTTSRWETGDRLPTIELLVSISNYYQVSIDYLLGVTDNPKINK